MFIARYALSDELEAGRPLLFQRVSYAARRFGMAQLGERRRGTET
ncbi:MAG: hypothetical protein OEV72_11145 [Thermoleophilia bacterium]|nr:hypothetical protein [Thermoleophilia bacterium]